MQVSVRHFSSQQESTIGMTGIIHAPHFPSVVVAACVCVCACRSYTDCVRTVVVVGVVVTTAGSANWGCRYNNSNSLTHDSTC
jgi:hypothetical protein